MKRQEAAIRGIAAVALAWLLLSLSPLARAQTNPKQVDIDIGEMPLTLALQEFSKQTGLQHLYLPSDKTEEEIVVGPVRGHFTASEILTRLLPVGFTFSWSNDRTVAVLSPSENVPPGGVKPERTATDQQHSELSKEQQLSMVNGGGRSGSARGPYAFDWSTTVEGKRFFDSVFDGLDLDMPATVLDREDIDASGVSTVADLFRYIPQQPNMKPESYLGDGTQFADLRGLGFDSTLVLINGRRTIATASALLFNAFDLNTIPLGAVERIEIVSDSTSAIYGADAIGGVVNIVLRDNVPEPRLDIDYGAAAGGAVERHAAFSASVNSSRARGSIVLDYFDRSPLLGRERDRWNNQDFTRFGSMDWRSPTASPGNVSSATFANLPGLSSSVAAIPDSSLGVTLTPADFAATAGQQNLESLFRYSAINFAGTRKGATAQGEYKLTPEVRAYGELMYVDREIMTQSEPPAVTRALVSGENPYNPFGTDVLVDALLTDLGPRTLTRQTQMVRAVGGLQGQIRQWDWEASLQRIQDDAVTLRANDLDGARVTAALMASDPHDALNLFGGLGANSPALLASLLAKPSRSDFHTEANQAVASLRGALASLPAGSLRFVAGGEWREERVRYDIVPPVNLSGSHERSIAAAFGELRFPIVGEGAGVTAVRELALVLSGRFDDYSDIGHTFNPEYALIWRPTSALTVRTSLAQSFRPPPLADLYLPPVDTTVPIVDPARNGEFALPIWRAGGNPDLKPSSADSLSVGIRFEPKSTPALRLWANYWQIAIDDIIAIPVPTRLLAGESLFPERVIRGLPSASDVAAGIPGPLQVIDIRRLNNGAIRTSGVDASASVVLDTPVGQFKPELSATWVHDFTTTDLVEGPGVGRVGVANRQGTIPRWHALATIGWNRRGIGLTGTMRYVPSYDDVDFLGTRNGRNVDCQTIVDAQLSLNLGDMVGEHSPWNDIEVRAGALNIFNAQPPFADVAGPEGLDRSQAELKQRFAYVKVAKKF